MIRCECCLSCFAHSSYFEGELDIGVWGGSHKLVAQTWLLFYSSDLFMPPQSDIPAPPLPSFIFFCADDYL